MAAYTTSLRLVQPATGEYSGTWGTQVNTGLTALVDASVAGTATITMTAADYTLSTANGASDEARAMVLNLTGTPGAARNVICPAVSKVYIVYNNTTGGFAQTVKTASGSGVSVPNGATAFLRCNGTDVVTALSYLGSLTLGAALPIASGGTGSTSTTYCSLTTNVTGTLPATNGGTGQSSYTTGDLLVASSGTALTKLADIATGNALISGGVGVAPSYGKIGLTTHVSGTLPVGNGGTGATTLTANNVIIGNGTSAVTFVAPGTAGNALLSNGTTWASTALGATAYTWTAKQTLTGSTSTLAAKLVNALETVTLSATAATGTIAYDVTTQSVLYYTTAASANWTVNFRASSGTTLNAAMATGESVTVAFLVTQGATARYNTAIQVDGTTVGVTANWQGGTAPAAGTANGVDVYTYTIIKTGASTYTVFAAVSAYG